MKLSIGTVQLGMNYGVSGVSRPEIREAVHILEHAVEQEITAIDTACAYGEAEDVVGKFLQKNKTKRKKLHITSKLPPECFSEILPKNYKKEIETYLDNTLKKLNTEYLDAYLFHTPSYALHPEFLEALHEITQNGKVRECGVSVYEEKEAEAAINNPCVSYIQLPFSVFDQRMVKTIHNSKRKITIAARSAFLQGVLLMEECKVPSYIQGLKPYLTRFRHLCNKWGLTPEEAAVGYVKAQQWMDYLVFGVDTLEQIDEMISAFKITLEDWQVAELANEFTHIKRELVMPNHWKKG